LELNELLPKDNKLFDGIYFSSIEKGCAFQFFSVRYIYENERTSKKKFGCRKLVA
jgi:hypothetical protein